MQIPHTWWTFTEETSEMIGKEQLSGLHEGLLVGKSSGARVNCLLQELFTGRQGSVRKFDTLL